MWSFLIDFGINGFGYFNYGYWGWPKELQDCINWMQNDGATYNANQGVYTFASPVSSAPGSVVTVDMTSGGTSAAVAVTFADS